MARQTLPGVRVGPLDPDATENFGQVSGRTSARQLIRTHAAAHPAELVRALALPRDDARTEALNLSEVAEALGDDLPDGAVLSGAAVRGDRDRAQLLTYTYTVESGRTAKWYTEFDADRFPESAERGDAAVRIEELRKTGLPLIGEGSETDLHIGGADRERLRRENANLREERDKLLQRVQEQGVASGGGKTDEQRRSEAEDEESDEPVDGYAELKADEARKLLKDADRETTEAVLEYEQQVGKRSTVISAAEQRLDQLANDQGDGSGG